MGTTYTRRLFGRLSEAIPTDRWAKILLGALTYCYSGCFKCQSIVRSIRMDNAERDLPFLKGRYPRRYRPDQIDMLGPTQPSRVISFICFPLAFAS